MKLIHLITSCVIAFTNLEAAEPPSGASVLRSIDWSKEALPPQAKLDAASPDAGISIINTEEKPVSVTLYSLQAPGISTKCYALRGRIRYRDVAGVGYLQLWNEFPAENAGAPPLKYFTRTLAEVGPMQKISGTSSWRPVWLPFDATQSKSLPSALQLDLVLPGRGSVDLGNLELIQFADAGAMWAAMNGGTGALPGWVPGLAFWLGMAAVVAGVLVRRRKVAEIRRMRAMDLR